MHTKIKTRFTKYLCFNQNNSIIEIENKLSHQLFRVYIIMGIKKVFLYLQHPTKGHRHKYQNLRFYLSLPSKQNNWRKLGPKNQYKGS